MTQTIYVDGQIYPSKAALRRAIQAEVGRHERITAFESSLISDLVATRHPYRSRHNLRPTLFRAYHPQPGRQGYHFQAYFEDRGWKGLSWNKCINPTTFHEEVRKYLRWTVEPMMQEARKSACEYALDDDDYHEGTLEVDHSDPTFEEMYQKARVHFTPEEEDIWAFYDWDTVPGFRLPPDHQVFKTFMALHQSCYLQTLCTHHHRRITNQRKEETKA